MYRYSDSSSACAVRHDGRQLIVLRWAPPGPVMTAATLKTIGSSRVDARPGVIAIEASDPVPYVASQPDPRTFVVELRDVVAAGFADNFNADPRQPDRGRAGRERAASDGASVARVRHDARPADAAARAQRAQRDLRRGRSHRSAPSAAPATISNWPARQRRFATCASRSAAPRRPSRCSAPRALVATSIQEPKDGPPRLVHRPAERDLGACRARHARSAGAGRTRAHRAQPALAAR